jgi:hypothetical protein
MKWNDKIVYGIRLFELSLNDKWKYVERLTKPKWNFKATIEDISDLIKKFEVLLKEEAKP